MGLTAIRSVKGDTHGLEMDVIGGARRGVVRTADATTATAGAIGGAVVTGALGAVESAAAGVKNGVKRGGHSPVAAALTLAAIGAVGLVEWPIVVGVGGAALLIHQLGQRGKENQRANPQTARRQPSRTAKRPPRTGGP